MRSAGWCRCRSRLRLPFRHTGLGSGWRSSVSLRPDERTRSFLVPVATAAATTIEVAADFVWTGEPLSLTVAVKLNVPARRGRAGDDAGGCRQGKSGGKAAGGDRPGISRCAASCRHRARICCVRGSGGKRGADRQRWRCRGCNDQREGDRFGLCRASSVCDVAVKLEVPLAVGVPESKPVVG